MEAFVRVAKVHELAPGSSKVVVVAGHPVALFRVGDSFHALSNVCLHRGGPVGEGHLDGFFVTCPVHGWEYDVRSGQNTLNPFARLRTFSVRVDGDDIFVAP
jgi:nitrite reductase (NADH) small subunit